MAFSATCHIIKHFLSRSSARPTEIVAPRSTTSPMELTIIPVSGVQEQSSDLEAGTTPHGVTTMNHDLKHAIGRQHGQTDDLERTADDHRDLLAMQIEPVFRRRFGLTAVVALGMSVVVAYQNTLATMGFVLYNGGTGGVFFGSLLVTIGFIPVYASLAELSSW
jgi:hypothetical protein